MGAAAAREIGVGSLLPARTVATMALFGFAVLTLAAWKSVSTAPLPDAPDPGLFTIATRPAELPKAPPPTAPGAAEYQAGLRLMHQGDFAGALAGLAAAVAASPGDAAYHNAYGHALQRSGDPEGGSRPGRRPLASTRATGCSTPESCHESAGARTPCASTGRSSPSPRTR